MNIEILDFNMVDTLFPSIEGNDMWTISIVFKDSTCLVYGYIDRDEFRNDYKELQHLWRNSDAGCQG